MCFLATEQVRPFTAPLSRPAAPSAPCLELRSRASSLERRITPDLKSETTAKTASGREGANLDKFFVVLVEVKLFVRRIFHTTAMVELFEPLLSCP